MQPIDEPRLETDAQYRYEYLAEFIGFTPQDAVAIQRFAPHLGPRVAEIVERIYETLLRYDATARHFVPRQHGCDGEPPSGIGELHKNHSQIRFRKDHLNRYFMQLIGRAYDAKMVLYLDMVGKIHTPEAGNNEIDVPLVQMNALMGLISDVLFQVVSESPLSEEAKLATWQAFQRLLWIQNDFITRHYCR